MTKQEFARTTAQCRFLLSDMQTPFKNCKVHCNIRTFETESYRLHVLVLFLKGEIRFVNVNTYFGQIRFRVG